MQRIEKYFAPLTPEQREHFTQLGPLYGYWNQRINVISRKDIENLYLHHVLHSLSIAAVIRFNPGTVILDAGTGGGFPGIPLAILFPETKFILADSIGKKIRVAESIIRELGLRNCQAQNLRLETFNEKVDFVVCRAVTEISTLLGWVGKNIRPGGSNSLLNGLLALKGGDLNAELSSMGNGVKVYNLNTYFTEPFFETKQLVYVPR